LLAIGVGFCLIALIIWPSDWRRAVVTLVFFGASTLVFAHTIVRKLRARRFRDASQNHRQRRYPDLEQAPHRRGWRNRGHRCRVCVYRTRGDAAD
jgi:hypothetical protein